MPENSKLPKTHKTHCFLTRTNCCPSTNGLGSPGLTSQERPRIPSGIYNEIKIEANGECAICNSNRDTCEAAHLEPVSKSKNNHPENLLWLCSNHHTVYDHGLFGPDPENEEFVVSFKRVLYRHKKMLWAMQHEVSRKLFLYLYYCDQLAEQRKVAKTQTQKPPSTGWRLKR